jgi:hypothetical protein
MDTNIYKIKSTLGVYITYIIAVIEDKLSAFFSQKQQ